jgi:hypothetical protein
MREGWPRSSRVSKSRSQPKDEDLSLATPDLGTRLAWVESDLSRAESRGTPPIRQPPPHGRRAVRGDPGPENGWGTQSLVADLGDGFLMS